MILFVNGLLLTQEPARPVAQALAIENGRIVAVGSRDDVLNLSHAGSRTIDLGGRTLIPGFNDAHAHVWKMGQLLTGVLDLRSVRSLRELAATLKEKSAGLRENQWLQGRGWNEASLEEGRAPTRSELDAACPGRPVVLTRTCGHIVVANSRALELAGVGAGTDAPPGGVIDRESLGSWRGAPFPACNGAPPPLRTGSGLSPRPMGSGLSGRPTGILRETAVGLVNRAVPPWTASEIEAMVIAGARRLVSRGVTSASDCGVRPDVLDVYRDLDATGTLPARMNVMPLRRADGEGETLPLPERHVSDFLRVDTVKLLVDGGLSGATAALSVPYQHANTRGVFRLEPEDLFDLSRESVASGFRLALHAIGDAAIDRALSTFEALGASGLGHRIEHMGLPSPEQLARAARLRVVAVPQTIFLCSLGANFRRYLPPSFLGRAYPVRSMLEAGLRTALSSDAPVVSEDSPLLGMKAAIDRRDREGEPIAPGEGIAAAEALMAYTLGGALATGDGANRGSLRRGKWADLAVLSDNPLEVEPDELPSIQVEMTFVSGALRFEK